MGERTYRLDKIVRDGIVESTEQLGGSAVYRLVTGKDKLRLLIAKLQEEAKELGNDEEPSLDELADLVEVIEEITIAAGRSLAELQSAQDDKSERIGSFVTGTFVETVTVPEGSDLDKYYGSDPDRFPEVKPQDQGVTLQTLFVSQR